MAEPQEPTGDLGPLEALGPLIKPLSDAEMDKRRRMYEESGTLNMDNLRCLMIFIREGLA